MRVAWAADAPGIAAVQARAWQERYDDRLAGLLVATGEDGPELADQLAEAWRESLTHPPEARHRALVALVHDQVVGFALTGPCPDPDADPARDGELAEITVAPDATRAGHGSRLLQAGADTLVADGFERAVCWVAGADDVLRGFLTDAGWAPDGATRELADESGGTVKQVRLHTALA